MFRNFAFVLQYAMEKTHQYEVHNRFTGINNTDKNMKLSSLSKKRKILLNFLQLFVSRAATQVQASFFFLSLCSHCQCYQSVTG